MTSLPPAAHALAAAASRAADESISESIKRMRLAENHGLVALNDEVLLLVFSSSLDTTDLLRCAATCRRWRRLITSEAAFICRRRPPSDHLVNARAVRFFHHYYYSSARAGLQFPPPPSFRRASLDAAFDGDMLGNSRLIASRNGLLLLELRRRASSCAAAAALRLAVCNAITSSVIFLPSLPDMPQQYACALLTADDLDAAAAVGPLPPEYAAVVLLYKRGDSMACRSCSSDDANAWGSEGKISGANLSSWKLAVGGGVFWVAGKVVFGLRLDTLHATVESPKWYSMHSFGFGHQYPDRRLVVLPAGRRLGAVQIGRGDAGKFVMNIFSRNDGKKREKWVKRWVWEQAQDVDLEPLLPPAAGAVKNMRLRAVSERNGLVFSRRCMEKKKSWHYMRWT